MVIYHPSITSICFFTYLFLSPHSPPTPSLTLHQGTVAIAGGGFIAQSKRLPGVEVVEITQSDRDAKTQEVAKKFLKDQI